MNKRSRVGKNKSGADLGPVAILRCTSKRWVGPHTSWLQPPKSLPAGVTWSFDLWMVFSFYLPRCLLGSNFLFLIVGLELIEHVAWKTLKCPSPLLGGRRGGVGEVIVFYLGHWQRHQLRGQAKYLTFHFILIV